MSFNENENTVCALAVQQYQDSGQRGNPFHVVDSETADFKGFSSEEEWAETDERYLIIDGEVKPALETQYSEEFGAVNRFSCPQCGTQHTGHPDECDNCGVEYEW